MIGKKINKSLKNTKEIWKDILKIFYEQNTFLISDLLNTNDSELVFANNISYLGGIGITIGTEEVLDPNLWKTPNIVGNVLMELRSEMSETVPEEQTGGEIKEIYKTDETKEKEKKAAIINAMKKRLL